MFILTRKDLHEAVFSALGGAVVIGLAVYFKSNIEIYLGETFTKWLIVVVVALYLLSIANVIDGWVSVRDWERRQREVEAEEKHQLAELEREEEERGAEWGAFTNWVKQNPVTAERLMLIVENEQIKDPEYRAWIAERREAEGPNVLTDLPRLFDWLKGTSNNDVFGACLTAVAD